MPWLVWLLLTLLAVVAGYIVAVALYPDRGTSHRVVVLHLVTASLILGCLELCGYTGHLDRVTLGVVSLLVFSATIALAGRHVGWDVVRRTLRTDARAPLLMVKETWTLKEPAVLTFIPAALALGTSLLIAWTFRSWTFDPVWYHVPITGYAIQNASLGWVDTHVNYIAGYPNDIEVLAVWNCIFPLDNRFDETSQFPFVTLGMAVTVAWARRGGASRPFAASLGAAWVALPPVFLLAHTTYVDIGCAACFAAAIYFAIDAPSSRDRWMCLLAMGLFVGTKYSGAYQLLIVAPWLAVRAGLELWNVSGGGRQRLRRLGDVVLSVAAFAAVGLCKYVQNALHTGNPLFPFRTKLPLLGITLPGPEEAFANVSAGGDSKPWLFGSKADLKELLDHWLYPDPGFTPEMHDGGFGPSFLWLMLPCVFFVAGDVFRARRWKMGLPVLVLFLLVMRQPMGWWPRYTLAAPIAAAVALGMVHSEIRSRVMKLGVSLVLVWLVWAGYDLGKSGFKDVYPSRFARAWNANAEERAWMQLETFHWPEPWARLRETELDHGDVVTYDDSASFIGEYFTRDYRARVTYVKSSGDPKAYVARLRELHARWVGVTGGTLAEEAVKNAGGVRLFQAPETATVIYRMPR
jgi:hypothetical protein